jgi:hypothetical protein
MWESAFEKGIDMRKAGGEKSYQIFHTTDDSNDLVLLFEWDNLGNARKYVRSEQLREAMKWAGVVGEPDVCLLEEVEKGSV